eukprot:g3916.t1
MLEASGVLDSAAAIEALCLRQSCRARSHLFNIFRESCASNNRELALLRMIDDSGRKGPMMTPSMQQAKKYLEGSSQTWKCLDCSTPSKEIVAALPQSVVLLSISGDANLDNIYIGAWRCGGQVAVEAENDDKDDDDADAQDTSAASADCAVQRLQLNAFQKKDLFSFLASHKSWRKKLNQTLIRNSAVAKPADDREGGIRDTLNLELEQGLDQLETIFSLGIEAPHIYKDLLSAKKTKHIVILLDWRLSALPFESMSFMADLSASISRDFSIHTLHKRVTGSAELGAGPTIVSGSSTYIVDPRMEDFQPNSGDEAPKDPDEPGTVLGTFGNLAGVGSWTGVRGDDHTPSHSEWQQMLAHGGAQDRCFLYYGLGRCLANFSPTLLAGMAHSGLNAVLLVDRAASDVSARRIAKEDNQKTVAQIALEEPIETTALFTLAGANAILSNQWATSTHANRRFIMGLFANLKSGDPLADAVKKAKMGSATLAKDLPALKRRVTSNPVIYGLPHIMMK